MISFSDFCTDYFKKYFDLHPTEAIYYGIEGYDHLLNDYSDETYRAEKTFVEESLNNTPANSRQTISKGTRPSITPCSKDDSRFNAMTRKRRLPPEVARHLSAGGRNLYSHGTLDQRSGRKSIEPVEPDTRFDPARHRQSQPS